MGALVVALLPVVLLPQLIGGVHPSVMTGFLAVELVAYSLMVAASRQRRRPILWPALLLPLAAGLGLTLCEVVPLPHSVRASIAASTETRDFVVVGLPAALQAMVSPVLSMDPPETRAAALRLMAALLLGLTVASTTVNTRRRRVAWRVVGLAGALLFASAALHTVANIDGAWGTFTRHSGIFYAPIVNNNHASKLYASFAVFNLAAAALGRQRPWRLAHFVVGALCAVGVLLTFSRGGMVALATGIVVLALLRWPPVANGNERDADDDDGDLASSVGPRAASPRAAGVWVIALLLGCVGVVGGIALLLGDTATREVQSLTNDIEDVSQSKLALVAPALELLDEHVLVGVGNNAFAVAFTRQATVGTVFDHELTFSHVENLPTATVVEHGAVPGAALLLLGAGLVFVGWTRRRHRAVIALGPAIAVLLVGDLFDFALETSAGISLLATLLGLLASGLDSHRSERRPEGSWLIAAGAPALVGFGVLVFCAPSAIGDWRYRLDAAIASAPAQSRATMLERALAAHPFDAQFCYLLAVDARYRRAPAEAIRWANRALILSPLHRGAHLEAARALAVTGHLAQAMLEYREAARATTGGTRILQEAFARTDDLEVRRRALPDTAAALATLCVTLDREDRTKDAFQCAVELAARADATERQRVEVIRLRTRFLTAPATPDSDLADADSGPDALRAELEARWPVGGAPPRDGESAAIVAGAWSAISRLEATREATVAVSEREDLGLAWSRHAVSVMSDRGPLLRWRLQRLLAAGAADAALADLRALKALGGRQATLEALERQEADILGKQGRLADRLRILQRLSARSPDDAELQALIGLTEFDLDRTPAALKSLQRARSTVEHRPDRGQRAARAIQLLARRLGLPETPATTTPTAAP